MTDPQSFGPQPYVPTFLGADFDQWRRGLLVGSAVTGAFSTLSNEQANQSSLESSAANLLFESGEGLTHSQQLGQQVHDFLQSGVRQSSMRALLGGMQEGQQEVESAGRGIDVGKSLARELGASIKYETESDRLAIELGAHRQAQNARMARVNARSRARMAGISAQNLQRTAGAMNPWMGFGMSLLGSAGMVAANWKG